MTHLSINGKSACGTMEHGDDTTMKPERCTCSICNGHYRRDFEIYRKSLIPIRFGGTLVTSVERVKP